VLLERNALFAAPMPEPLGHRVPPIGRIGSSVVGQNSGSSSGVRGVGALDSHVGENRILRECSIERSDAAGTLFLRASLSIMNSP